MKSSAGPLPSFSGRRPSVPRTADPRLLARIPCSLRDVGFGGRGCAKNGSSTPHRREASVSEGVTGPEALEDALDVPVSLVVEEQDDSANEKVKFERGADEVDRAFFPHEFVASPGELTPVDRTSPALAEDEYEEPENGSQSWRTKKNGYLLEILKAKVYDVAVQTPLDKAEKLSMQTGNTLLLKREDLQPVFSFKLRGAYNKMASLSKEELRNGVICSSAGNHAQGVALGASKLGCHATICMPTSTPSIKIDAVKRLGATVELVGESYQETQAYALEKSVEDGLAFVAPYDDPYTIAGQGTIGKEILEQIHNQEDLDTIFVAVGGGGLIAGIACYVKTIRPDIKVIGVEPSEANAMAMSLAKGKRVRLSYVDSFADGVAVKQVGKETFRLCRKLVDGVVLVDNSAVSAAIKDVYNETRSILEPAGAVAVAGAKAYLKRHNIKGSTAVAVCSGANINFNNLRLVADLADVGANKEAMLTTKIPEANGAFKRFVDLGLSGTDIMVTEFKYRFTAGADAHILWSVAIRSALELTEMMNRLNDGGFPTTDISDVEEALEFVRGFVGGRPRCYMGEVPHEKVMKVTFPERVGALRTFLEEFSPRWNFTMFCYRNFGSQATSILIGVQVPPHEQASFDGHVEKLEDFTFSPISEKANDLYKMFLK
ncbi:hypothetical protein BSKO_13354 [Bryopsis sp. KO-2023]|nr:hypothetical protein BSKO_13354 [Bryopsis sp. KO-2023]